VFSAPNGAAFQKAFEKVPFIVSFSSFPDESTLLADLVLPDKTYLEKHQYAESSPVSIIPVLGIGKPAVENLYDTRATEDIILDLASKMGEGLAGHFPWKSSREFLHYKIDGLFRARKGTIFTDAFEESQLKLLEERGWWVPQFSTAGEYKDELIRKGGWWDPHYDYGVKSSVFKTPSRKFEFYSQIFAAKMAGRPGLPARNPQDAPPPKGAAEGDDVFMPHYEKARFSGDEKEYPLYLHIHQPLSLAHPYAADQPWVQEIMGFHLNMNWDSWAEIHPRTAEELGISDRDTVWVESIHGKVRVIAKIFGGAMPGIVSLPFGLGHKALGQWARLRGVNPMELIGAGLDEWTGQPLKGSARIKVYKA
jgi:anaerobic selenocysteine-containing dehydrogenase